MAEAFSTLDLLQIDAKKSNLHLTCVAGKMGLDRRIESRNVNRPGLALGGFFDIFSSNCIQIFGRGETDFIKKYKDVSYFKNVETMLTYKIPCCIFSNSEIPPKDFLRVADENNVPVLVSTLSTADLVSTLFDILSEIFSLKSSMHGVFIEVFGIGVLLLGKSGIGKSETALELVQRGHRLIADDTILIKSVQNKYLVGESSRVIKHHMEIRGIGIINVRSLYGIGAVRNKKKVQVIVELEKWDSNKEYERIGIEEKYYDLLGIKIPYQLIPVMPGRNIPIIIETAAMNQRLKLHGINSAKEFNKVLVDYYETEELKNSYFFNDK